MKVKSESEVAQSCSTLSDPIDGSPPGSSFHGVFQARVLEWGAIGPLVAAKEQEWDRVTETNSIKAFIVWKAAANRF